MGIDENMINEIVTLFQNKLNRKLTFEELKKVHTKRTLIGYELIIDTLKDKNITRKELENYLKNIE